MNLYLLTLVVFGCVYGAVALTDERTSRYNSKTNTYSSDDDDNGGPRYCEEDGVLVREGNCANSCCIGDSCGSEAACKRVLIISLAVAGAIFLCIFIFCVLMCVSCCKGDGDEEDPVVHTTEPTHQVADNEEEYESDSDEEAIRKKQKKVENSSGDDDE